MEIKTTIYYPEENTKNIIPDFEKWEKKSDRVTASIFCETGSLNVYFWKDNNVIYHIHFEYDTIFNKFLEEYRLKWMFTQSII